MLKMHYCIFLTHFYHHDKGEGRLVLAHLHIDVIFALQKWRNFAIALRHRACARTIYLIWQSLAKVF